MRATAPCAIASDQQTGRCAGGAASGGALLVAAALFMEYLDGTIIATALPHMAESFGVAAVQLNIGITAYLVAVGTVIPLSGWLAERLGSRRLFIAAMLLFALASLGCAASPTLATFVAARIVQGIAAAMMTPVGRLLVLGDLPKRDLVHTVALLTWPALLAPAIAPPLGGIIVENASWRWIFLLNLPLGLIGAIAAPRLLPGGSGDGKGRLDGSGFLLWAAASAGLVVLVGEAARLPRDVAIGLAMACIVLTVILVRHLRRAPSALFDLTTLRTRSFGHAVIGGSLVRMAILANPFLLPLFLQIGLGFSAARAGVLILIGMVGNIAMKFLTPQILTRYRYRTILLVNGTLLATGFAAFAFVGRGTSIEVTTALLIATGLCRSMHFTALNTLAFTDIPLSRMTHASTLFSTAQQLNAALGVAVAGLAIEVSALAHGRRVGLADFHFGFLIVALLAFGGTLDALRLSPNQRTTFPR